MRRFRLLRFYVAGLLAIIGLAVAGVSMKRANDEERPEQHSLAGRPVPGASQSKPCGNALLWTRLTGAALTMRPEVVDVCRTSLPSDVPAGDLWQVKGTTRPAPGRKGIIAPVPLHPVIEVKVKPGDRVKKNQVLITLDADELRADVRAKKAALAAQEAALARLRTHPYKEEQAEARAALDSALATGQEAREVLERLGPVFEQGAVAERTMHAALRARDRTAADERVARARLEQLLKRPRKAELAEAEAKVVEAKAALEATEAELEHYAVTSPIDGVVSWLDVYPGTVSRPGTTVWGEVLDLSELDVQCDLKPSQAMGVRVGDLAIVRQAAESEGRWYGRVNFVGVAADPTTGQVRVLVRVSNPAGLFRCHTEVVVIFGE
jgi:HlyD family secretion protein